MLGYRINKFAGVRKASNWDRAIEAARLILKKINRLQIQKIHVNFKWLIVCYRTW